jgi:hypothetical protein
VREVAAMIIWLAFPGIFVLGTIVCLLAAFSVWTFSLALLAFGWQRKKTWLLWLGGVPFAIGSLLWVLLVLMFWS